MKRRARSRVVFFLPNLQMGGAESMTVLLASWLAREGLGISNVVLHAQSRRLDHLGPRLAGTGVTVLHGAIGYVRTLLSSCLLGRETTFVAATETYPVLLSLIARLLCPRSRLLLWLHTDPCRYFQQMPRFGRLYRYVVQSGLSHIICVSAAVQRQLIVFAGKQVSSVVIHNAIDPDETISIRNACQGNKAKPTQIGYVGRISREKGIDSLLLVFGDPNFNAGRPELSLSIFTDEAGERIVQSRIKDLTGCRVVSGQNKISIYGAIGTVVIASWFEGFSLVCLEAITGGLNIVYRRELDAVRELLDITNYPAANRFEYSTHEEMATTILKASTTPRLGIENYPEISALSFAKFAQAWRSQLN